MTTVKLVNGEMLAELEKLPESSVDIFILDLPYGQTSCEWDVKIDLDKLWIQLKRLRRNANTPFFFFCTTMFGFDIINSNRRWFRYDIVWDRMNKSGHLNSKKMPMRSHEMIYVFYEKLPLYDIESNHRIEPTDIKKNTDGTNGTELYRKSRVFNLTKYEPVIPGSILSFNSKNTRRRHPTEKPVDIYKWIIKYYSNPGDTVLDPCFGSGNSAVAARELGRNYVGIELNEEYFQSFVSLNSEN